MEWPISRSHLQLAKRCFFCSKASHLIGEKNTGKNPSPKANSLSLFWKFDNHTGFSFLDFRSTSSLTFLFTTPPFPCEPRPVSTRRRFDVHTTSITLKRRRMDVKTTSCAYWAFSSPICLTEGVPWIQGLSDKKLWLLTKNLVWHYLSFDRVLSLLHLYFWVLAKEFDETISSVDSNNNELNLSSQFDWKSICFLNVLNE